MHAHFSPCLTLFRLGRGRKNRSFHKDHTIFPAAPRQAPDSERQEKTGNSRECWKPKILRRKEERGRDGWPLHGVIAEGRGEANIPPDHKSQTLPANLEMPEEVLQFMPADIGQTNGSNCLPAQLVAGMDDGVCGTVMKQRHSRPFTVFKTDL